MSLLLDTIGALARYISPDVIKPVAADCMELGIVSIYFWCENLSENGDVFLEGGGGNQEESGRGQKWDFIGFLNLFVHGSGNKFFQNEKLLWKWGLFVLYEY